ncbi:MAG TPA: recombinase RecA [Polyangium sp.]|nr:recombinase RecA [Polyangium sp.]
MLAEIAEKVKSLKSIVGSIEKQHGKGSIMALGDEIPKNVPSIGTGSIALDQALGVGGYPRGRVIEIYGPESGGKTTLTLHAIREVQRTGGLTAFVDAEHAFDANYARAIGVDTDTVLFSQPDCGEQALDIVESLVRCGQISLIVVDSVAALVPKAEIEGDMGDSHMGLQARLMSQALRKLTPILNRNETTIMFINQLRHKIGVTFGSPETTTGGNALKYYASVRLDVRRIGTVKAGEDPVGSRTRVKVVKNKVAPPFREAEFDLRWGKGIDDAIDLIDHGCLLGVIEKSGSHMSFAGEHLGQGRERSREALLADPRLMSVLRTAVMATLEKQPLPHRSSESRN